jgi:hypothetical protein
LGERLLGAAVGKSGVVMRILDGKTNEKRLAC